MERLARGIDAQCPYCLAHLDLQPAVGKSLLFLTGTDVGHVGVVQKDVWGTCPSNAFLVRMPYSPAGTLTLVTAGIDLFLETSRAIVPDWMPPLSVEDNGFLHLSLVASLKELQDARNRRELAASLEGVIATCWSRRMPLTGIDLWPMLSAHGVASRWKTEAIDFMDFGLGLLIGTQGRKAVKRRRMPPMSRGRYLTERQRELWLRQFGHN